MEPSWTRRRRLSSARVGMVGGAVACALRIMLAALSLAVAVTCAAPHGGLALTGALAAGPVAPGTGADMAVPGPRPAKASPIQAFLVASSPDSLIDLKAHYRRIGVLYPTYFECGLPGGQITGADDPGVTDFARWKHLTLMPRFNCQDAATVHRILTEPLARAQTLAGLAQLTSDPSYAGLNLDFENDVPGDREALTSFVGALAAELHVNGKRLAVDVDGVSHDDMRIGTGFYDDRALAAEADTIFVMAWGSHWEGSTPGPIAPLPFVRSVAAYVAVLPNARRFVLGVPMYGLDWPSAGGPTHRASAYQFAAVRALAGARRARPHREASADEDTFEYTSEGVAHRVWYLDARAVADRLRIGRSAGLAVGVWRLGGEDQTLWSSSAVRG
jgi:spore germination protein YaaH